MGPDDDPIVKLLSNEDDVYELPLSAARLSKMIETAKDCDCAGDSDSDEDDDDAAVIPIPKASSNCLARVVEFCKHHAEEPLNPIQTPLEGETLDAILGQQWYREYIGPDRTNQSLVFELVAAANFMEIQPLLDLACLRVSIDLQGKSTEEIRVMLNIPKMTPEEEKKAREEHSWIFEE